MAAEMDGLATLVCDEEEKKPFCALSACVIVAFAVGSDLMMVL